MPYHPTVPSVLRLASAVPAALLALSGCAAPLAGTGVASGLANGAVNPRSTAIYTHSQEAMGMTGRPSRIFRVRIEQVTPTTIDVSTSFSSGDSLATNPTAYYFHLVDDRGHRSDGAQVLSETIAADAPRAQTYRYQAEVEDGDITNDAGEVIGHTNHVEDFTGVAVEHYYTRNARLRFNRNSLGSPDASSLTLQMRDLRVSADFTWRLDGSGSSGGNGGYGVYGGNRGYGPPPPPPPRGYYKPAPVTTVASRRSR